jgi:hypothetical protein
MHQGYKLEENSRRTHLQSNLCISYTHLLDKKNVSRVSVVFIIEFVTNFISFSDRLQPVTGTQIYICYNTDVSDNLIRITGRIIEIFLEIIFFFL